MKEGKGCSQAHEAKITILVDVLRSGIEHGVKFLLTSEEQSDGHDRKDSYDSTEEWLPHVIEGERKCDIVYLTGWPKIFPDIVTMTLNDII